ncbi:LPXTG cell wall anchor domain-containing protein [Microbacterium testaceum]|uniref:LPXTG cell wall anchor domain-containing protein n=1 Tax=Microbacterium testaceum TaxID=2033 RepID=UPI002AC373EC|nr:LPXTG cell wall anchor domain-containing protein [Microbacterium testaceum]MDZ5145149.1 LPXTG cell wall anchor domain-containing protein [Microbacterium testaceum]
MIPFKATAAVLVASVLWVPLAAGSADSTDDSMVIQVQVPARTDAPTSPSPTPTSAAVPDAGTPRAGTLPATGVEVALWGAALAAAAVATGAVVRVARRRRRA